MEIKLQTTQAGLETLIKQLLDQQNKVIKLYDELQTEELQLDYDKAVWTVNAKDTDPKMTQVVIEAKLAVEFQARDKKLLVTKRTYKEAEAELNCLENQLSASKRLMEVQSERGRVNP